MTGDENVRVRDYITDSDLRKSINTTRDSLNESTRGDPKDPKADMNVRFCGPLAMLLSFLFLSFPLPRTGSLTDACSLPPLTHF